MSDGFVIKNSVLKSYFGPESKTITIPDGVYMIGDGVFKFYNATGGFNLVCNKELKVIGRQAFKHSSCNKVFLNSSLGSIMEDAFAFSYIQELHMPCRPKLYENCFRGNHKIRNYQGVIDYTILNYFYNCETFLYVNDSLTINDYTFRASKPDNASIGKLMRVILDATSDKPIERELTYSLTHCLMELLKFDCIPLLKLLLINQQLSEEDISFAIDYCIRYEHPEELVILLNYKAQQGMYQSIDEQIKDKFSLD